MTRLPIRAFAAVAVVGAALSLLVWADLAAATLDLVAGRFDLVAATLDLAAGRSDLAAATLDLAAGRSDLVAATLDLARGKRRKAAS